MQFSSDLGSPLYPLRHQDNDLQYVKCLQQVVNDYYNTHTKEAMTQLEQQTLKILDIMYESVTKHNFGSVDRDLDKVDTNKIKLTYDNDSDTNTGGTKYDQTPKVHTKTLTQKIMYRTTDTMT